jgi:hypothetical protein
MSIRVFDATIAGLILVSLIFLGMVFLIIDIPMFNYVNLSLLEMTILGLFLGLAFGLIGGYWYTKQGLEVLSEKNEMRGFGSRKNSYAVFSGLGVFLIYSFFVFYFKSVVLADSVITFVISATLTAYIIRLVLVYSWEKRKRRTIMMGWTKSYTIPK